MNASVRASASRAQGFTLLELLVVLVLAAVLASAVGLGGQAYMERSRYSQTVRDVASQLHKARALSVQEGRAITVTYEPESRRLVVDGASSVQVPEPLVVQWAALERKPGSRQAAPAGGQPIFVFNADGGARGGRIAVLRGSQGLVFRVNWLFGTVEQAAAVAQS